MSKDKSKKMQLLELKIAYRIGRFKKKKIKK